MSLPGHVDLRVTTRLFVTTSPSQPTHEVRLLHDCRVPMRDGISLSADVYLPLGAQGLPTIVQWTPYESTRERFVAWGAWFARRGYAAVVVDVRGRYESGGTFTAWTHDGQDAHDTLTWAAEEQWSNGRIGTWGRSYGGLVQWQLAHLGHPSLQCIAPQVIHDDYFWDGYWTGGAFQLALTLGAAALWSSALSLITGPSARDLVLNDRVFGHLPLIELDEVTIGRKVDYWRLWWEHQLNDEYWQRFRHRPERVDVPIFQQGGWFDPYSGSHLRSFAAIGDRLPNRVLIGPWSHEEEVESFRGDIDLAPALTVIRDHELLFYDRFLKDEANGWDERPPAELYVLGANEWRGEREWPLARTEFTAFHLRKGSALAVEAPRPDEPADRYAYDPAHPVPTIGGVNSVLTMTQGAQTPILPGPIDQRVLERRDDVLVYTSEPLDRELEAIGPVEVVLYAASSARDTDFVVRLCDVFPDGRSIFLTEGIIRARYRGSVEGESTELLEPGEVAEYRIRCYPVANVFRRGHRIRLDVTSSSFPRFSRNLNTGEDVGTGTRMEIARQSVLHTSTYPSHVLLPVIPQ
ncbi:MAG: CocE/NonD family hydrolase [Gaiella sp.]